MASKGVKHVYILGAGFSVPLGGPLFNELFSRASAFYYDHKFQNPIETYCSDKTDEERWNFVRQFHWFLNEVFNGVNNGDGVSTPWNRILDAERMLELLEVMVHGGTNWLTSKMLKTAESKLENLFKAGCNVEEEIFRLVKTRLALETNFFSMIFSTSRNAGNLMKNGFVS
ncbi:MAG: hypothetical protein ACK5PB_03760 [Pirellula sp.]|jgi:hypothetical protein